MSNPITKEMWEDIEAEMSGSYVDIAFSYKGHLIQVVRVHESESKTCLEVYIDEFIKGEWISFVHQENDCVSDKAPSILKDVWCRKTRAKYNNRFKVQMIKIWGKREVKRRCPDLEDKYAFYGPHFSKSSVLCRQFKKLDGLELTKAMFLNLEEKTL